MSEQVDVSVGIVICRHRGAVLACLRRPEDYYGGWWEFPGGKCLPGEPPSHCVTREIREELGIEVRPIESWPVILHHYADRDRRVCLRPFVCEVVSGDPTPLEVAECRWCTPPELRSLRFLPANAPLIEAACRLLSATPTDLHDSGPTVK
ncbi:MAG: (deoxy)nucleoside triphosphate pyrophosphohydrolase [Phycisphaerae bacterium]|nr:(deoxy)nucleoside triphosphate pyrophosphohydrolase [Phycisphaerae bacterium]MDW8262729.1 (deoxy)nucleoside triphosphate pyrophosphohydrolase [Phycisphaerales bacterium]